jgi:hypothetical protein
LEQWGVWADPGLLKASERSAKGLRATVGGKPGIKLDVALTGIDDGKAAIP